MTDVWKRLVETGKVRPRMYLNARLLREPLEPTTNGHQKRKLKDAKTAQTHQTPSLKVS
jgi:hypothetical protein